MSQIYLVEFIKPNGRNDRLEVVVKNSGGLSQDMVYLINYVIKHQKTFNIDKVVDIREK